MSAGDPTAPVPHRILLYGVTGSGKSTAALRIGERLGIPVTLADEIGWLPGWVNRPLAEQIALVDDVVAQEAWILDSAYSSWKDRVIPRVELIVGLDYPRWFSLQRLIRRTLRRIRTREEVFQGNVETWKVQLSRESIIRWHFASWARKRARMRAWAADPAAPPVLLFRRARDLERWVERL
ncbi:adenylate kinase [Microbacterium rhizophilus]|uniref:adenylate kinase n=1 Tax=Microbacterium rhizophilus TaxID=3138934 RepID=UPI0031E4EE07